MKDLTIVIPSRNDETRLTPTVKAFSNYFPEAQIFIVTNNCIDRTEEVAADLAKKMHNVHFFSTPGTGKGRAVHAGLLKAKTKYAGFVDSDMAITPKEYAKLLPHLKNNECVIASRWLPESQMTKREPLKTQIASRGLNLVVRMLFGIDIKDSQCGAKVFHTDFIKKVVKKCVVKDITFDVELLWRVKNAGGTIKEVPIVWHHDDSDSKTRVIKNSWLMLKGMARMVMHK